MADALSSLSANPRKGLLAAASYFMARIVFLHSRVVATSLFCAALARADALIEVGNRNQLFIDHRFIARSELIALRMNPPEKLGLILDRNSHPWPEFQHTGRVFEDQGKIGLVSADADYHGGWLLTPPLLFEGNRLRPGGTRSNLPNVL